MTIRLLLADDQTLVRSGFRMILRAEPDIDVVGEAADGAEAIALARELDPDVVLMDVRMPNVDGIEATRRIMDGGEHAPRVLVLTTFDLDEYVFEALRAGASGFLLKDAPEDQLVSGIRIVAVGASLFAPAVTRRLIERFAGAAPIAPPPALGELTPRELEVLRLVARGLSNAGDRRLSSFCPSTPPRPTSRISSTSSTFGTGCRRSSWPTSPGSLASGRRSRARPWTRARARLQARVLGAGGAVLRRGGRRGYWRHRTDSGHPSAMDPPGEVRGRRVTWGRGAIGRRRVPTLTQRLDWYLEIGGSILAASHGEAPLCRIISIDEPAGRQGQIAVEEAVRVPARVSLHRSTMSGNP
jgi:DNA-binding NarL/FixJ family response regulator